MYHNIMLHLWFRQGLIIHVDLSAHFQTTVNAIHAAEQAYDSQISPEAINVQPWTGDVPRTTVLLQQLMRVEAIRDNLRHATDMLRKIEPSFNMFDDLIPHQCSNIHITRRIQWNKSSTWKTAVNLPFTSTKVF